MAVRRSRWVNSLRDSDITEYAIITYVVRAPRRTVKSRVDSRVHGHPATDAVTCATTSERRGSEGAERYNRIGGDLMPMNPPTYKALRCMAQLIDKKLGAQTEQAVVDEIKAWNRLLKKHLGQQKTAK